ncbi:MAG TPA: hypothetical protein VKA82_08205 [Rubrobacter sp.]|nr:hypothetical protein [Rubrobacter sp.]
MSVSTAASVSVPLWAWSVFVGLVLVLLFLDPFVLHRKSREAHMAHGSLSEYGSNEESHTRTYFAKQRRYGC